jgi:hypothetical protein
MQWLVDANNMSAQLLFTTDKKMVLTRAGSVVSRSVVIRARPSCSSDDSSLQLMVLHGWLVGPPGGRRLVRRIQAALSAGRQIV